MSNRPQFSPTNRNLLPNLSTTESNTFETASKISDILTQISDTAIVKNVYVTFPQGTVPPDSLELRLNLCQTHQEELLANLLPSDCPTVLLPTFVIYKSQFVPSANLTFDPEPEESPQTTELHDQVLNLINTNHHSKPSRRYSCRFVPIDFGRNQTRTGFSRCARVTTNESCSDPSTSFKPSLSLRAESSHPSEPTVGNRDIPFMELASLTQLTNRKKIIYVAIHKR